MAATAWSQQHEALAKANQIRMDKANIKKDLRHLGSAAAEAVAEMVSDPSPTTGAFTVGEALRSIPLLGNVKARKLSRAANISEWRRLRDLTANERERLAKLIRYCAPGRGR